MNTTFCKNPQTSIRYDRKPKMKKIKLLFCDILRYVAENRETISRQLMGKVIRICLACNGEPSCIGINFLIEFLSFLLSVAKGYMEDRRNKRWERVPENEMH